jgi:hypothetical protein
VQSSRAISDLDFFRVLRQFDPTKPEVRNAIGFSRIWADLAQRLLCALSAQSGAPPDLPPALAYPTLLAYLEHGPTGLQQVFLRHLPLGWSSAQAQLLAAGADWLAQLYDAGDPQATSYQVWVGEVGEHRLRLFGPPARQAPPPPLELIQQPPLRDWLSENQTKPAALIAHYDLHGLAMLALTLRHLRRLQLPAVDCALGFEWTGDISKLWKRAVPKTVTHPSGYSTVALIDCSVHSRNPEYTLKALSKLSAAPHCRLVIIDHHVDTALMAAQLAHPQVQVVLTDVLSCGLSAEWDAPERNLRVLGALGDKVSEVALAYPQAGHRDLYAAAQEFNRRMIDFSPTPPALKDAGEYPMRPLWEVLAAGREINPGLAQEMLGALPEAEPRAIPSCVRVGSLLMATGKLSSVGRTWYGQLEALMEREGAYYAAAIRLMDGKRANILLLTDWRSVHLPPVRVFVPEQYLPRCLGHPAAVWADLDKADALEFLSAVTERLNQFLGTPGAFKPAGEELQRNILNAVPTPAVQ